MEGSISEIAFARKWACNEDHVTEHKTFEFKEIGLVRSSKPFVAGTSTKPGSANLK